MLSIDGTFFCVFVSFLIFMTLMNLLFFKPVSAIKTQREALVRSGRQASDEADAKRSELEREVEARLSNARHRAHELIAEKRSVAQQQATGKTSAAQAEARETIAAASQRLAATRDAVREQLQGERDALARTIVEKLSSRTMTPAG